MDGAGSNGYGIFLYLLSSTRARFQFGGTATYRTFVYWDLPVPNIFDSQCNNYTLTHTPVLSSSDISIYFDGVNITKSIIQDNAVSYPNSNHEWD